MYPDQLVDQIRKVVGDSGVWAGGRGRPGSRGPRLAERAGLVARGRAVIDRVDAGDPVALAVWQDVTAAAGLGIAGLAHLFSPQLILIGGGPGLIGAAGWHAAVGMR